MNEPHGAEPPPLWGAGRLGGASRGEPAILFGQVHEDAAVELAVLAAAPRRETVLCIGSGGDTAFAMLLGGPGRLVALDVNPAQVRLIELKRAALAHLDAAEARQSIAAAAWSSYVALRPHLPDATRQFWDRHPELLRDGLTRSGVAERRLTLLMRAFRLLVHDERTIEGLLTQPDVPSQRRYFEHHWDTWRWRTAFDLVLSRAPLRLGYSPQYIQALPASLAGIVRRQVERGMLETPIRDNPYVWQAFLGRYPPSDAGLPLYLRDANIPVVRDALPRLEVRHSEVASWLEAQPAGSIDCFALSNVLDAASESFRARLWCAVAQAASPGALVVLRSIFPPLPDPASQAAGLRLDPELTERVAVLDRSLVCRFIRVYLA